MKGNEFIRKIQALAKERGVSVRLDGKRGKHAMCSQLGIRKDEL
jgi:hypothetical protein